MIIKKEWRSIGYGFRFGVGHPDGGGVGGGSAYGDGFSDGSGAGDGPAYGFGDADPDDDWYYTMRQYYQS